jgi:hypothetical protein
MNPPTSTTTCQPWATPAYGEYHVIASDQPGYAGDLHMAVVRDGPILVLLNVWEFLRSEGAQPQVTGSDVGTIATTAVDRLP